VRSSNSQREANDRQFHERRHPPNNIDIVYGLVTLGSSTTWAIWTGWLMYFYLLVPYLSTESKLSNVSMDFVLGWLMRYCAQRKD